MAVTIKSTMKDGTQVEVTIDKTDTDKGTIRVKKWKKGKNPATDKPDEDETTKLYDIKAKQDGSKIVCQADVTGPDPTVTITINCPEPPKKPSITVVATVWGKEVKNETYEISEADQTALKDFIKASTFPQLALASGATGGALALLTGHPGLLSPHALDRLAVTLVDVAASIRRKEDDWIEQSDGLSFVGFDPGIDVRLTVQSVGSEVSLKFSAELIPQAFLDPNLRFKDAFLNPSRSERVGEFGEIIAEAPTKGDDKHRKRP